MSAVAIVCLATAPEEWVRTPMVDVNTIGAGGGSIAWIDAAGLQVLGRRDVRPQHPRAQDASDPLHAARAAEVTSLWRLGSREGAAGAPGS